MLDRFTPVTPAKPSAVKIAPPMIAPKMPRRMSRTSPSPVRFTILLPMKPAMSPTINHDRIPMMDPPSEVLSTFCASYNLSSFDHNRPPRPVLIPPPHGGADPDD